ncbi:radical SAM domain protein [Paramagnetospirillum magnetotacticum MS-1]|uniref:Radical SAM domain protein n=1 Tax=Paramagnetospirillum magnetotacticum MS-1 TaxID=272627 RepID=A0A0C2YST3_PARME|nr:radical SAM protein [Paramagnetospirillum magnetotacticum]KIL97780.1 radical SAM domain protein [Paramagnetospirillum magnetotacticum MS-1]
MTVHGLPAPSADTALYQSIMEAGFTAFPERLANWRRFKAAQRGERLDYLPVKLDVEHVSRCNYRCTMCQVSDWPKMTRAADMTVGDFKSLLEQQIGVVEIKLQGMGEPLLAAESFFEMIRHARERHIWVRATTNGSLLHIKENYKGLVESDICEIQVSIDGARPETYEAIRRGGKFERVAENCRLLNAHAAQDGRERTRMWVVVQQGNLADLDLLPKAAAEMGFKRLTLSLDLTSWGQETWERNNEALDAHDLLPVEKAWALVEEGKRLGVEVTFWAIDSKYDWSDPAKLCPWPFERAYIASDMRVVPCCMIANPDVLDMGDARDLTGVWTGERMAEFRRAHLEGRIPEVCNSCYRDPPAP